MVATTILGSVIHNDIVNGGCEANPDYKVSGYRRLEPYETNVLLTIHTFLSMIHIIKRYAETDVRIHFKADFDYNVHQADPFRTVLTF